MIVRETQETIKYIYDKLGEAERDNSRTRQHQPPHEDRRHHPRIADNDSWEALLAINTMSSNEDSILAQLLLLAKHKE
jgi:hypothetical protein